ncbi:MAG: hypothetical protein J6331_03400, partial [Lentisphaeria bacterium]|nr:hypothetical protein [Lentisphaeria bacterium]
TRGWKNGAFQEAGKRRFPPAQWETPDKIYPRDWIFPGKGKGALKEEEGGNKFMELEKGVFFQTCNTPGKRLKIRFRARWKGKFSLVAYRYTVPGKDGKRKHIGSKLIKTFSLNSEKWEYFKESFERPSENETTGISFAHVDGVLQFDDVFVSVDQKEGKE